MFHRFSVSKISDFGFRISNLTSSLMSSILPTTRLCARATACAGALLLISACGDIPKYKHSSGKFPEWADYEGKHFYPANGTVTAIDTTANTVTIGNGDNASVFAVTPSTRIVHEGTDIPLAQLPLNQSVKLYQIRGPGTSRQQ